MHVYNVCNVSTPPCSTLQYPAGNKHDASYNFISYALTSVSCAWKRAVSPVGPQEFGNGRQLVGVQDFCEHSVSSVDVSFDAARAESESSVVP